MGADIYMHSQVKDNNKWVWYDLDIYDYRNYVLFGILCGMRGTEFKPIADWKYFPQDSEDKLKIITYDENNTTESGVCLGYTGISWLTLTELRSFDWTQKIPGRQEPYNTMEEWTFVKEVLPYLEAVSEKFGGSDNVRIVFGFSV